MRLVILLIGCLGTACSLYAEEPAPQSMACDTTNGITSNEAILRTQLLAMHLDDPSGDAAERLAHGDYRILAIRGLVPEYPFLDVSTDGEIPCVFGLRFIDGTTDGHASLAHSELISRVAEYARLYNSIIIEYYKNEYSK